MNDMVTVDSMIIEISITLIGIIIAFGITSMSGAYRYLVEFELSNNSETEKKSKDKINSNRKKLAEMIQEYIKSEIRCLSIGITLIILMLVSFFFDLYQILPDSRFYYFIILAITFGWIILYMKETYDIMNSELNEILGKKKLTGLN